MSPAMTGALAGALIGLMGFAVLRHVASSTERASRDPHARRTASILRMVAFVDLLLLPTVGYFVGPLVLGVV